MAEQISTKPAPFSVYHPSRPCTPCILCGKTEQYNSHFEQWSRDEKAFLIRHLGTRPELDSCICRSHKTEANRHCKKQDFIPKWKRCTTIKENQSKPGIKCSHPQCTKTSTQCKVIKASFAPVATLADKLNIGAPREGGHVCLCEQHYNELYRQINPTSSCVTCGATPKRGTVFTRHCPNAEAINTYLSQYAGFEGRITPDDVICTNCYKAHSTILEDSSQIPTLETLEHDIIKWKQLLCSDNQLTNALLKTVINVATEFLHDRSILLPQVSSWFLASYGADNQTQLYLQCGEAEVRYTSMWLLQQIKLHLKNHLRYRCVHKKFGVILYRNGGDIFKALSWALADKTKSHIVDKETSVTQPSSKQNVLQEAANMINGLLLDEVRKTKSSSDTDLSTLNIQSLIDQLDPDLWEFVCTITQAEYERYGTTSEAAASVKQLRRFFIITMLTYCTNLQCPTPFHTLMTDTIETCGGSRKLIKILSRLGVAASVDTHDRFVTHEAEKERKLSIWDHLNSKIFTVASADNFDLLKSNADVYCGDMHRSYHGTTIQVVQPNPLLGIPRTETGGSERDGNTTPLMTGSERHGGTTPLMTGSETHGGTTPLMTGSERDGGTTPLMTGSERDGGTTPLMTGSERDGGTTPLMTGSERDGDTTPLMTHNNKRSSITTLTGGSEMIDLTRPRKRCLQSKASTKPKRPRTIKMLEHKTPSYSSVQFTRNQVSQHSDLELSQFIPTVGDNEILTNMCDTMFTYMLSKHINSNLKGLRHFLQEKEAQPIQPSNVHYMELLDENADSKETMRHVMDLLLTEFQKGTDWVVLVGDWKTYSHLLTLKQQYGEEFRRVLPFPGDWHTLYNYQQLLIKVYYDAGLRDMAKASGFRGETLTSLSKGSNFKRTHAFLLQAWEALYTHVIGVFLRQGENTHLQENIKQYVCSNSSLTPSLDILKNLKTKFDAGTHTKFESFCHAMSHQDDTWKFWLQFVFQDCLSYITLFFGNKKCRLEAKNC